MTKRGRGARRPGQQVECGWCGKRFPIKDRGRTPRWCSASCRQRAWEQRRAADSGLAAIEVVDRVIEREKVVYVVEDVKAPSGPDWPQHLDVLTRQVQTGRFYDRDIPRLAGALDELLAALAHRPAWQRLMNMRHGYRYPGR